MSHDRGLRLQNRLAEYLRQWWPSAESTGAGRPGGDVLGTPGIVWENKTANQFRPSEFVEQARGHGGDADLPVVVYWPPGTGEKSADYALGIVPLARLVELLVLAGYAGENQQRARFTLLEYGTPVREIETVAPRETAAALERDGWAQSADGFWRRPDDPAYTPPPAVELRIGGRRPGLYVDGERVTRA